MEAAMTTVREHRESPWLLLVVGLFMVYVLLNVALLSASMLPALGVAVGLIELTFAWRLSSTPSTRIFRWLLALFGVATIALSAFVWAVGGTG